MPATAAEATREQLRAAQAPSPSRTIPTAGTSLARDWPQIARALAGTDEDDVPLFGHVPA